MTDLEFCCDRISHTFHNRTGYVRTIDKLTLTRDRSRYRVASVGTVEFAREGVANDERFAFEAMAVYRGAA